ncbi:pimeloyl-ACP methyl ester carboxylesterase [Paenibacillus rhizosphaerae]|uniref:Pimeloyl-ACP methyl ester carboxylesterase n=1 Tax=Paenibacillus rhizosphaerae TaxID=297318 RepID=A0A839U122_9BACL|nr:alpha/beta hydrolase [Paenibacillus rhizosphaerae]MBB3131338.1 pimeloyl-ACP methyl ester carboxylesterase [Paenibacillus rhizosphaerae]
MNALPIQSSSTRTEPSYKVGSVISRDGTVIGYRQFGQGPGIVIVHGANLSSQNFMQLAQRLADAFTVYVPDRRGRGLSGPFGEDYSIRKEVEDLEALLTRTGTYHVFGISSGGLIALEAALTLPAIRRVALYEPALLMNSARTEWLARYDQEIAQGKTSAALVTCLKGLQLGGAVLNAIPRRLLEFMTDKMMDSEDKKAKLDDVTMRILAPTLHYDGRLLVEMTGKLDRFRALNTEALLLGGKKGLMYLKPALDALENMLPQAKRKELPGLDHGGPCDISNTNRGGKPELVALELRQFFS